MKLIIDIDDETYNDIQSRDWKNGVFSEEWKAIHNGIPLDNLRAEIIQTADEEQKHDKKWAIGLRYAVKIIDKYRERSE